MKDIHNMYNKQLATGNRELVSNVLDRMGIVFHESYI
jgi:hypothetical protein